MPSTDALETIPEESSSQDGGTVMDQEMDINKDVDEDNTEVQVQPNTSGGKTASDRMSYNAKVLTKPIEETKS
ncbi:unnamed protein product [Rhizophagus irregularis]|nr:unnamed protein product [Rhizophagus irregularis]